MPKLTRITLFPIKSLDGIDVMQTNLLPSGALTYDRRWAIVDSSNKIVNAKRTNVIHQIRSRYNLDQLQISLQIQHSESIDHFHLINDQAHINAWLSQYFGFSVHLIENATHGLPDDTFFPGPTIVSDATLNYVSQWFQQIDPHNLRQRLRTNLEITVDEPFWEDQLFAKKNQDVLFNIGHIEFIGGNPCQRCVVPPRDPITGNVDTTFSRIFTEKREQTLPVWSERTRFNHFYRLCVNTKSPSSQPQRILQVGDELIIKTNLQPAK